MSKKKNKSVKLITGADIKNAFNLKRVMSPVGSKIEQDFYVPYYKFDPFSEKISFKDFLSPEGSIKFDKIKAIKFKLPSNVVSDLNNFKAITKKSIKNVKIKDCKNTTEFVNVTMDINTFILLWNRFDEGHHTLSNELLITEMVNPATIFIHLIGTINAVACDKDGKHLAYIAFLK